MLLSLIGINKREREPTRKNSIHGSWSSRSYDQLIRFPVCREWKSTNKRENRCRPKAGEYLSTYVVYYVGEVNACLIHGQSCIHFAAFVEIRNWLFWGKIYHDFKSLARFFHGRWIEMIPNSVSLGKHDGRSLSLVRKISMLLSSAHSSILFVNS